ncbi:hypothetical protein SAMN04488569_11071, partial [Marinilactibacillus piezotolerans]
HSGIKKAMDEKYHTWHKYFVYLPVYLTGSSSKIDPSTPNIIEPFLSNRPSFIRLLCGFCLIGPALLDFLCGFCLIEPALLDFLCDFCLIAPVPLDIFVNIIYYFNVDYVIFIMNIETRK